MRSSDAPRKTPNPASPSHRPSMIIWRGDHFDQSGYSPAFSKQASEDRPEVIVDLHGSKLAGAVLPYLVGFTDRDVIRFHQSAHDCFLRRRLHSAFRLWRLAAIQMA